MKKLLCASFLILAFSVAPALAQQPGPELVEAGVAAYNNHDMAYFEQHLADDVVWLDEDGHIMNGKSTVLGFMGILFNQTPAPTLSVSNIRIGNTADAAWATYQYTLTAGEILKHGGNPGPEHDGLQESRQRLADRSCPWGVQCPGPSLDRRDLLPPEEFRNHRSCAVVDRTYTYSNVCLSIRMARRHGGRDDGRPF